MPSFDIVNYSLRPSKSIQRQVVFEGIRSLKACLHLADMVYIGFGSIWFTDFGMAHKSLGIIDMISMERNIVGYKRARYNAPYASVRIIRGNSWTILPRLCNRPSINARPWVVWLDYDRSFDEEVRDDVRSLITGAPDDTIFLVTVDAREVGYGARPADRSHRLRELFGNVAPDALARAACRGTRMQDTLAALVADFMQSIAEESGRPGGFVPGFRLIYKDTATMLTVGGILPTLSNRPPASAAVSRSDWRGQPEKRIVAPHLTVREALALQAELPRRGGLTRARVQKLGFDLTVAQVAAFDEYYREYPAYAQIIV